MTTQRQSQLETLLRKLRQRAFDEPRCAALIHRVKARLMPEWKAASDYRLSERMLRLWN